MNAELKVIYATGEQLKLYFNEFANLRLKLFSEFPYLYDGNLDSEKKYLSTYAKSPNMRIMLLWDNEKLVGATTALLLKDTENDIKKHFINMGFPVNEYFYLGEALLLPDYRGKGIYRKFFEFRENAANEQGYKKTAFISVIRSHEHPLRPQNYQPLHEIWQHFGYHLIPDKSIFNGKNGLEDDK